MMEVSKKVNERLTEIHRALDILRKEGASSGDVDNMLEELEDKIIQEEMFPFLREAVGPALSPLRHRLSLVVDYMPGAPLNIRIDKILHRMCCRRMSKNGMRMKAWTEMRIWM